MSANERPPLSIVKTPVRNRRKSALRLRLEPWGEDYVLAPGKTVQVLARGPEGDTLDIEWGSEAVTIYGWPGSIVELRSKGVDIGAPPGKKSRERKTAPYLPEGMRVREWIAEMAG